MSDVDYEAEKYFEALDEAYIRILPPEPWREVRRHLGHHNGRNGSWIYEGNHSCVRWRFEPDVIPITLPRLRWWRRLARSPLPIAKVLSKRGVATK